MAGAPTTVNHCVSGTSSSGAGVLTDPSARTQRLLCRSDELTFTPENRALAARTADGVVTWDFHADRGRPLPGEGVNSVEFAPTGARTSSAGVRPAWPCGVRTARPRRTAGRAGRSSRSPLRRPPSPTPRGASPCGTRADSTGSSSWQSPTPPSSGPPWLSRPTARCWPRAGTTARSACGRRRPRDGRERPCRPVTDPSSRSESPRVRGSCTPRQLICRCVRHS